MGMGRGLGAGFGNGIGVHRASGLGFLELWRGGLFRRQIKLQIEDAFEVRCKVEMSEEIAERKQVGLFIFLQPRQRLSFAPNFFTASEIVKEGLQFVVLFIVPRTRLRWPSFT